MMTCTICRRRRHSPCPRRKGFSRTTSALAPQWLDRNLDGQIDPKQGEHNYPLVFKRDTKLIITNAAFQPGDMAQFQNRKVKIRGTVLNGAVPLNVKIPATDTKFSPGLKM